MAEGIEAGNATALSREREPQDCCASSVISLQVQEEAQAADHLRQVPLFGISLFRSAIMVLEQGLLP